MKKLIAIMITFIFIFDGTGYCLRVPLMSAKSENSILKRLGIKDLDSDRIGGLQIKTWLKEHRLFSHLPPLKLTSYLDYNAYEEFIHSSRNNRRLHDVKQYILNYGIELYITENNPGYQQLVHWMNSLEDTYNRHRAEAEERGEEFKEKFVDYLNGRADSHVHTTHRGKNNISPLEWAAQGRFFWQVHETRHGLLFGKIDISDKSIGDLPLFPVDDKGRLDQGLIQWMFQKDSIPPLEYYQAKKESLKKLLELKKENDTAGPVQLEFDFNNYKDLKFRAEYLDKTALYEIFKIEGRIFNAMVDLTDPEAAYVPEGVYMQFGEKFSVVKDDDNIAIGLNIQFQEYSSYILLVDTKKKIIEIIDTHDAKGLKNKTAFNTDSGKFICKFDVYKDYVHFDLIGLTLELREKHIMGEVFERIVSILSHNWQGVPITVNATYPTVTGWFETYFRGTLKSLTIAYGLTLDTSKPYISVRFFQTLVDLKILSEEDIDVIFKDIEPTGLVTNIEKVEILIKALHNILSRKKEVLEGKMTPWQYLLHQIVSIKGQVNIKTTGFIMQGVIPTKGELQIEIMRHRELQKNLLRVPMYFDDGRKSENRIKRDTTCII